MAGARLIGNDKVREEIMRLKEVKKQSIMMENDGVRTEIMRHWISKKWVAN